MKIIPLIKTNLRGFMRDWVSVLLLVGVPIILIGLVFMSFSTSGTQIPVGAIYDAEGFNTTDFKKAAGSFAEVTEYESLDGCMARLMEYKAYACIVVGKDEGDTGQYSMTVHYENTKEVIGGRTASKIESVANLMDIEYSKRKASRVINEVKSLTQSIRDLQSRIRSTDRDLETKISELDAKIAELKETRTEIMRDRKRNAKKLNETESDLEDIDQTREHYYTTTKSRIDRIQLILRSLDDMSNDNLERVNTAQKELQTTENELVETNDDLESDIGDAQSTIDAYQESNRDTKEYVAQINRTIKDLKAMKKDLIEYRTDLDELHSELERMEQDYARISGMNPSGVANSMSVDNRRAYAPEVSEIITNAGTLLTLQTIYSTLLLLVSLFVSLLVAKFITLKQVNSEARPRMGMIRRISFAEYFATYTASMMIIAGPVICVLLFGEYIFQLSIFSRIGTVLLVMALLCSATVNLGMLTAYIVKKKSITLLVGSFILVFLIFFSGFVLPIEMMRETPAAIASILPGTVALEAFDLAVLYGQPLQDISRKMWILFGWNVVLGTGAYYAKRLNEPRKIRSIF